MNNCVNDKNNEIIIPQNNISNFKIIKNKIWKDTIDIIFKIDEEIDYLNLYLILKSYFYNLETPSHSLCTAFEIGDKIVITQKENVFKIKTCSFENFIEWINYRIKNDWEYDKTKNFYKISIMFEKKLLPNDQVLENLKPLYPWKEKWLNYLMQSINEINFLKKKIEMLEIELKSKK